MSKVNFSYRSIGNLSRLLSTIQFEKSHGAEDITVWHQRHDNDESDELFEEFLAKLFPEGGVIGVEQVNALTQYAEHFLDTDKFARQIRSDYRKFSYGSWVYFKPDQNVIQTSFGAHADTVISICKDYFRNVDDIDADVVRRFILDNFEVCSSNSSVKQIADDANYIVTSIQSDRCLRREGEARVN